MIVQQSRISDLLPVQNLGNGLTRQGFHDYQWVGIDRCHRDIQVVLADQPGLGKTFQILGTLERAGLLERPGAISLVLAPKIVAQLGWSREIDRFVKPAYPNLQVIYVFDGSATKKRAALQAIDPTRPVLIVANHNAIDFKPGQPIRLPEILAPLYDAIIIDEAHLVLPTREPFDSAARTRFWHGLSVLRHHPLQYRIPVSGTMHRGKLENELGFWRFMFPLHPEYRSFWGWVQGTFRTYQQVVNRRGTRITKIEQKPLNMIGWLDFHERHVLRRTKREVLPQLPPKQYMNIELDLTPLMRDLYASYEKALMDEVDARAAAGFEESAGQIAMKMYLRGRQMATCPWDYQVTVAAGSRTEHGRPRPGLGEGDVPKLDWIVEFLAQRAGTGAKVVIASAFVELLEWMTVELMARLPELKLAMLTGDTPDRARQTIADDFQTGDLDLVLLSQTIGNGITLDAADDLILVDVPKDPDAVEQVEDRVHRAGSFHQVTIWRLISIGTLDVDVVKAQDATYANLRRLSDSSRGVDESRKMLNKVTARATRARGKEAARG